jgi:hypothetical protein
VIAEELLADLRRKGAQLEARGKVLRVEAPRGLLSPELVVSMRKLKPELLRLVALAPLTVGAVLGGVLELQPSLVVAEVCAMRLEEFAPAGLVVEVRSKVLGEAVVLASANAQVDPGELRTVYRARELRALAGLGAPAELRRIHMVKKTFRGTITDAASDTGGRRAL